MRRLFWIIPGGPDIITRFHRRGKSREREKNAKLLALKMNKEPQAKKCRQFLEARQGKELDVY